MHALTLLKTDHRKVEELFEQIEKTDSKAKKQQVMKKIITELSVHASIEEQLFYPVVRESIKSEEETVLEALEEHHVVKWLLAELEKMTPSDERFDAKVKVLKEIVQHHVEEEENEIFPKVRKHMDRKMMNDMGLAMEAAKKVAPKHPHPRAPDTPPGNIVAGVGAGFLDRARDVVTRMGKHATRARRGAAGGRTKKSATARTTRTRRASSR
jgi:hemerythrin superfamily protein